MIAFLRLFLIAAVLAFLQAFIIHQVDMGVWLRPMPYLLLFFITPINVNKYGILIGGFFFGLFIDALSGYFGIHAASIVVFLYAKNFIDQRLIDFDSLKLQGENYVTINTKGWLFFSYYALSLIIIHHLTFFMLDYFEFLRYFRILISILVSALGSFLLILLFKSIIKS